MNGKKQEECVPLKKKLSSNGWFSSHFTRSLCTLCACVPVAQTKTIYDPLTHN